VLIAQAVFLLERGQTSRQTDAIERSTHAGIGNKHVRIKRAKRLVYSLLCF